MSFSRIWLGWQNLRSIDEQGKVKISELAAATAHREATIRLGLEWLAAAGHLTLEGEADECNLAVGDSMENAYLRDELYLGVKGLLEETAAYRAHFARAAADSIIGY